MRGDTHCAAMRVAVLTNIITPYRVPVLESIGRKTQLLVLHGGLEANRDTWTDVVPKDASFRAKKSWGIVIAFAHREGSKIVDRRYFHLNPGYLFDLIRFRPQAIISSELGFRSLVAIIYGLLARVPVWIWWEGTAHSARKIGRFKRATRRAIARLPIGWLCLGIESSDYAKSIGVQDSSIVQFQNFVDERLYLPGAKASVDGLPYPTILFVGQLIGRKGPDLLLRAASRLRSAGKRFGLLLVGNGEEEANLKRLADELDLSDVKFVPAQQYQEMPGIYASANAFVLPCLEDVWGLVVNEAIFSGLPVACSKYAGCAVELVPQQNIFDPLCEASIDAALKSLIDGRAKQTPVESLQSCEEVARVILAELESKCLR
jgi:glycosyltransferase involved in cell wall biosynthesis